MIWGYPPPWRWVFSRHGRGFSVPRALRSSCVALRGALCSGSLPGAGGSGEWCSAPGNWWIQQGKWGVQHFHRGKLWIWFFFQIPLGFKLFASKQLSAAFAVHSQLNAMLPCWSTPRNEESQMVYLVASMMCIGAISGLSSQQTVPQFFWGGRLLGQGAVVRMGGLSGVLLHMMGNS